MTYSSSSVVMLLGIAILLVIGQGINGEISADSPGNAEAMDFPGTWISDMFYEALANFTVQKEGNTTCQIQSEMYERNLRNFTSWAVKMAESWDRRPIGILTGNRYHFGIYDECVQVSYPVRGQYCLSEIKLIPPTGKDYSYNRTEDKDFFGNNHAWHTVLGWVDYPDQAPRNILNIGICIPDSCSALDLQVSLQTQLDKVFIPKHFKGVAKVDPIMCTVSGDMYPYNTAYYITIAFFSLLILICCIATLKHFIFLSCQQNKKEKSKYSDSYFNSFSFIKSMNELLKYDKNNELNILNSFKFVTMIVILFGHRIMYLLGYPMSNPIFVENIYLYGPDFLVSNMNIVDPFFFFSGYLMYITVSPVFLKSGPVLLKLASPIIYRIVRILPPYCAVMAIVAHIVPHLGDGPLWPHNVWSEAENCKNNWWTNIIFISNFMDSKNQCLIISWYISCDVQFFIIGVIILYVYTKNNKLGIGLLSIVICISLFVPFIMTLLMKWDGIIKLHMPFLENPRSSKTFNESYRSSYMRAIPFFIGLATGILIKKIKEKNVKFSLATFYSVTFIIFSISLWVQFYGAIFYKRQRPYYPLEQALYSTLSHCTYPAIDVCLFIFLYTSGYGPLTKLLNNRIVVPLGRLSYSVLLVNLTVMSMSQNSQRFPVYASGKSLVDAFIYDSFKTYLISLLFFLVVESPFSNVTRKIFGRGPNKESSTINHTTNIPNKETCNL